MAADESTYIETCLELQADVESLITALYCAWETACQFQRAPCYDEDYKVKRARIDKEALKRLAAIANELNTNLTAFERKASSR